MHSIDSPYFEPVDRLMALESDEICRMEQFSFERRKQGGSAVSIRAAIDSTDGSDMNWSSLPVPNSPRGGAAVNEKGYGIRHEGI